MKEPPWYQRLHFPPWFPLWLAICLFVGAFLCGACWFSMDRLSRAELAGLFALGFALPLLVFCSLPLRALHEPLVYDIVPPPWVWMPVVVGVYVVLPAVGLVYAVIAWFGASPANVSSPDRPAYVIWMLWGWAGWCGVRLLWISASMVYAIWAGRDMNRSPIGSLISLLVGAVGGYALALYMWPGLHLHTGAASVAGLVASVLLDVLFLQGHVLLMRLLLSWRLPHYRRQLRSMDSARRTQAAAAVQRMGGFASRAVPDLIEAVKDDSVDLRSPVLAELLAHANQWVRMAAAERLGRQGTAAAVPALKTALQDEVDDVVRRAVAGAIKLIEERIETAPASG